MPDSAAHTRLDSIQARLGYQFKDKKLLECALTHSSYGDGRRKVRDNERLEFLGDRVLGLLTAEVLFHTAPDDKEGKLARRLNALVRKETCARVARKLGLGDALFMSPSEERQGGREKLSILGDACEALIAALYIDGGRASVQAFYDEYWTNEIKLVTQSSNKDPKTELQEKAASFGYGLPTYVVTERSGPDHRPLFVIKVDIEGLGSALGTGKSKKDAERFAALHLLEDWPV